MQHEYLDYLDTPEWWTVRRQAVRRASYQCEQCGARGPLEVHHQTYARLGAERLEDLAVLCPACHRDARIPRNRKKRELEAYGQARLFDRWDSPTEWKRAA